MTTVTATTEKTALEVIVDAQDSLVRLRGIPTILDLMMENFGLDRLELTDNNKRDLITRHGMIADVLNLTISTIYETIKAI